MKFDTLILEIILLQVCSTSTIYQSGQYVGVNAQNQLGWNQTFYRTMYFSYPYFANVPQVIMYPYLIETFRNVTTNEIGYMFEITSISTTQFNLTMYSPTCVIKYLGFYWIAIDDKRVEVLSNFNIANPNSAFLQHNNPNLKQGIILLTSFYGQTAIDFTFSLGTINSTTVEVIILQQNMINLGYIVILGPPGFLNIENEIALLPLDQNNQNVYNSDLVQLQTNKIWIFFFKYFSFVINGDFRMQLQESNYNSTHVHYKFCSWENVILVFTQFIHQCTTLDFNLFVYQPMTVQNIRIATMFIKYTNPIELFIPEYNKNYTELVNNDLISILSNIEAITFKFKGKCQQNSKQMTALLYNSTNPTNYSKITRYCFAPELSIIFQTRFNSQLGQDGQYKSITVTMTGTQVQIYQILVNQNSQQVLIAQFQIQ